MDELNSQSLQKSVIHLAVALLMAGVLGVIFWGGSSLMLEAML